MLIANHKYALSVSTCLAAVALAGAPAPVRAADQTAQASGIEEVIVNARRTEENLQRVPITVTAMTAAEVQRNSINSITDFETHVPALSFCCGRGGTTNAKLRGVPGVLAYWAEAPAPLGGGGALYFDLENLQVLKGPQGTLFGLSTNGGAVLFQPAKPKDEFSGYVQGTAGTYDRVGLEGVLNVPIVDDKVLFRAGFQRNYRKGYIYDTAAGLDRGSENYWNVRAGLTNRISDSLENTLLFNYYHSNERSAPNTAAAVAPNGLAKLLFGQPLLDYLAAQKARGPYVIAGTSQVNLNSSQEMFNFVDTANFDINDQFSLKNIASYTSNKNNSRNDLDGSPFAVYNAAAKVTQPNAPTKSYSEELQLRGKFFQDRLSVLLGGFMAGSLAHQVDVNYTQAFGATSGTKTKESSLSRAIFGSLSYDLSDFIQGLKITGGYRRSWDIRWSSTQRYTSAGVPTTFSASKAHFHAPSYTLGLEYQYSADTMFYVTNSKGYSSGGFNAGATPALASYSPENLNNLEVGVKSTWSIGGMEARTNLGGYYGWYNNVQVSTAAGVPNGSGGTTIIVVTRNAATGRVMGIEGDFTVLPVQSLEISVNGGYTYGKYTKYTSLNNLGVPVDLSNTPFAIMPHWKFNTTATYHLPFDHTYGDTSVTLDWSYQGRNISDATPPLVPETTFAPFHTLNLSLDWRDVWGHKGLDASISGTNLTNNTISQFGFFGYKFEAAPGLPIGFLGLSPPLPQMWNLRLKYSF